MTPTVVDLFAGIGGISLGLQRAGFAIAAQVEIDPFCCAVLNKHWPEVPKHDDIRTFPAWWRSAPRPAVHLVAGGFPCQPVSQSGRRLGQGDPRWLWPEMAQVIGHLQPEWVLAENVPGLRTRGLAAVLRDLGRLGYRPRAGVASACAVGAPHARNRLFILAHTTRQGRCPRGPQLTGPGTLGDNRPTRTVPPGSSWWSVEPDVGRVAYGIPRRVDRCRALGNAVVPQLAEHLGRLINPTSARREEMA